MIYLTGATIIAAAMFATFIYGLCRAAARPYPKPPAAGNATPARSRDPLAPAGERPSPPPGPATRVWSTDVWDCGCVWERDLRRRKRRTIWACTGHRPTARPVDWDAELRKLTS